MARNSVHFSLQIDKASWARMDSLLSKLALEMRQRHVKRAVAKGARVVARAMRQRCPKPGYPGDKPQYKPLRDTISVVVREYGKRTHATIGPAYPAGSHGHLVEFGHEEILFGKKTGNRVPPHPFARPAFDESKGKATQAIVESLSSDLLKTRAHG